MKKTKLLLSFLLGLFFVNYALAQEPDYGNDPQRAKEKYVLFGDDFRAKNYVAAKEHLSWLLNNAPKLGKLLYQRGAEIYENLANTEKDAQKKAIYQDSSLIIYDLRIKYFGEEASVLNRKGAYALTYWQSRPNKMEDLYDLYEKIFQLNGENTAVYNIKYYMYLACIMKQANKKGLDDSKMLEIHEKLSDVIEKNAAKDAKYKAAWDEAQDYIDKQLEGCVKIDCAFVEKQYEPKFKESPKDTILVKKMYGVMVKGKCTGDELFFEVTKALCNQAPTFGRLKTLALLYKQKDNDTEFINTMERAFKYGGTNNEKAELYLAIAGEEAKAGSYSNARATALKAASIDPSLTSKVYSFIGYLYMNSGGMCVTADKKKAPVYNTVAYLAAYEMFMKAGDQAGASRAAQYFPTAEQIFNIEMTEQIGSQIPVGCWIGGTATLRKR